MKMLKPYQYLTLETTLSQEQCLERVRPLIDSKWLSLGKNSVLFGEHSVIGTVDTQTMHLKKRIVYSRNPWRTILIATLRTREGETIISCRFGPENSTLLGLCSALIVLAFMQTTEDNIIPSLFFVLMIVASIIGCYFARDEKDFLTEFLCENLDAKIIDPDAK